MPYRKISADLKDCAMRLCAAGWTDDDICEVLAVSSRSLHRWREVLRDTGDPSRPPSPLRGRTRKITRALLSELPHLYHLHPDTYLEELQLWLAINHDIAISCGQLHRTLQAAGLSRKLLTKIAIERSEDIREEWRELINGGDFTGTGVEFVFVDETSKNELTYGRRFGYAPVGERAEKADVFVRGQRYSVVAAMATCGYIAAQAIPGSFDSHTFYEFIVEDVVGHCKAASFLAHL